MTNSFDSPICEFSFNRYSEMFEGYLELDVEPSDNLNESSDVFFQHFRQFIWQLNPELLEYVEKCLIENSFDNVFKCFIDTIYELVLEKIGNTKFKQLKYKRKVQMTDFLKLNNCSFIKIDSNSLFFMIG
jgi:hypothetical protein